MSLNALRDFTGMLSVDVPGKSVAHAIDADPESVDSGLTSALVGLVCESGYAVAEGDTDELIYGLENTVRRIAESDAVRGDLEAEMDSAPEIVPSLGRLSEVIDFAAAEKRFAESCGLSLISLGDDRVWVEIV